MITIYLALMVFVPMMIAVDVQQEREHERDLIEICYETTGDLAKCKKEIEDE